MAQNATEPDYPSILDTPIFRAEGPEASKAEGPEASGKEAAEAEASEVEASESGRNVPGDPTSSDGAGSDRAGSKETAQGEEDPGGKDPGGLRRRFLRTLGTFAALVGLALALLAGLSAGPTGPEASAPSDSTGAGPPQKTKKTGPEKTSPESPKEEDNKGANEGAKDTAEKPSKPSETDPAETDPAQGRPGDRSYRYLGSVSRSVPETRALDNGTGAERGTASQPESPAGTKGQGDSPDRSGGYVPELTIRLGHRSLKAVAAEFGYQMVAVGPSGENSSESVVLGQIDGGRLRPMDKTELNRYAGRARSARKHPEYDRLCRRAARRLPDRGAGDVRLIYLVPKKVERAFVRAQMEAIRKRELAPGEVAVVKARYKGDSIEVTGIERKSGSQAGPR